MVDSNTSGQSNHRLYWIIMDNNSAVYCCLLHSIIIIMMMIICNHCTLLMITSSRFDLVFGSNQICHYLFFLLCACFWGNSGGGSGCHYRKKIIEHWKINHNIEMQSIEHWPVAASTIATNSHQTTLTIGHLL